MFLSLIIALFSRTWVFGRLRLSQSTMLIFVSSCVIRLNMAAFGAIVSFLTLARFVHTVFRGIDAGAMRDEFDLGQRMSLASHHRPGSGIAYSTTSTFRGRRLLRFPPTALPRSIHPKSDLPHTARPARPITAKHMFDIRLFLLYPTFVPTCSDTDADLLCLLLSHSYCAFCLILTICLLRRQPPYFLIPVLDPPLPYRDSAQFPPHPHHPL